MPCRCADDVPMEMHPIENCSTGNSKLTTWRIQKCDTLSLSSLQGKCVHFLQRYTAIAKYGICSCIDVRKALHVLQMQMALACSYKVPNVHSAVLSHKFSYLLTLHYLQIIFIQCSYYLQIYCYRLIICILYQ